MKIRTINDINDKDIGHKGFAKFVSLILADNHEITNIKEFNEKFKYELDGYPLEYDKCVKNITLYAEYTLKTLNMMKLLKGKLL